MERNLFVESNRVKIAPILEMLYKGSEVNHFEEHEF
jgi:hypothetical protein